MSILSWENGEILFSLQKEIISFFLHKVTWKDNFPPFSVRHTHYLASVLKRTDKDPI